MIRSWVKSLTVKQLYFIAILSVAGLILANQFVIQKLLEEQKDDTSIINTAGKQRMLSQRIASLSLQSVDDFGKFAHAREALIELDRTHHGLQIGDPSLRLPINDSNEVDSLFAVLNPYQQRMDTLIYNIQTREDLIAVLPEIIEQTEMFLPIMNEIVNQMERESEAKLTFLITIEMILALLSLIILGLEFLFIFRPIINEISRSNKRLKELNLSKDRIMSTVVHDLRTPFNGIMGLNSVLKEDLRDHIGDEQEMMFDMIEESGEKGLTLIQELLDIAVLESDQYHLEMEPTRIREYLTSILYQFLPKAKEKGVNLEIEVSDDSLTARIDQDKFARVIDNLITNALKFTESPGKVKVESYKEDANLVICVEDTGIGIPEDMQEFIFDKFSKARRLGLEGEKSSGLGMSIVKQIVEMHGGNIDFESEEKRGTRFYITLPAR